MLELKKLTFSVKDLDILKDVDLICKKETITAVMGASGSGKTTLLKCIEGLEQNYSGKILLDGEDIKNKPRHKTGLVFQHFNLFPHMTVLENLTFAPLQHNIESTDKIHENALKLLKDFEMTAHVDKHPHALSGGQKQRIAIARALILDPDLILFDEPTSALDPELVGDVVDIISHLKTKDRIIMVITHEMRLAQSVADHVAFFDHGKLLDAVSAKTFFSKGKDLSVRAQNFLSKLS